MKTYFPPQNQNFKFLQTNRSDVLGSLWSTFNIDLQSNLGVLRVAHKLVTNTTSSDDADLGMPGAFAVWLGQWWAICDTAIFTNASIDPTVAFTQDAGTGNVTTYKYQHSDLAVYDNRLWASTGGTDKKLYSRAGSTWTLRDTMSGNCTHKLLYFKTFDRLYYMYSANAIQSINAANTVASAGGGDPYTIILGTNNNEMTTMVATNEFIYIGTMQDQDNIDAKNVQGKISAWDGISPQVTAEYNIQAAGVWAMTVIDNIPYAIDSEGRILKFNGYSFVEIARLPINRTLLKDATMSMQGLGSNTHSRPVHMNGMVATKNNTILINVRNLNEDTQANTNENLSSGIWELDLATNSLTHRYSFCLKALSSSTVTDFGQNNIATAGAIAMNPFSISGSNGKSTLVAGSAYYTDASTQKTGIFIDSPASPTTDVEGQKGGYFVTPKYPSMDDRGNLSVQNSWQNIYTLYRKLLDSADKINIKFRNEEITATLVSITWVNTTSFTTATDVSALVGYEVEITQGIGSGRTSHVVSVTGPSAGLYTVTVDETYTGATTTTAKARIQNWKKISSITYGGATYDQTGIGVLTNWCQFKIAMYFTGNDEIERLIIISQDYNPAN